MHMVKVYSSWLSDSGGVAIWDQQRGLFPCSLCGCPEKWNRLVSVGSLRPVLLVGYVRLGLPTTLARSCTMIHLEPALPNPPCVAVVPPLSCCSFPLVVVDSY
jgi:hypothetical protein